MKVLVVHNRYRSFTPSGENIVVDSDIAGLRERDVDVIPYIRSSDEIESWSRAKRTSLGILPVYSPSAARDVKRIIERQRPDVLHLHNPFPLISPAVVRIASAAGVPVVQSVHNHRHVCVKGTYFRDGKLCRDCLGKSIPWPAVVHSCYQNSALRSVPMAVAQVAHRGTWQLVDRFLALTPQMADHLRSAGLRPERIVVRPNTVDDPGVPAADEPGRGVLFAGRLSEEKGLALLADAWARLPDGSHGPLTVAGEGPFRDLVEKLAATRTDVRVCGRLTPEQVQREIRAAAAVIVPSTCPEAFPRIVVEAFANGRPVIGTALGGLPGIVSADVGVTVEPDVASLEAGLRRLPELDTPAVRARARLRYETLYAPAVVHDQLVDVYRDVIDSGAAGAAAGGQPRR